MNAINQETAPFDVIAKSVRVHRPGFSEKSPYSVFTIERGRRGQWTVNTRGKPICTLSNAAAVALSLLLFRCGASVEKTHLLVSRGGKGRGGQMRRDKRGIWHIEIAGCQPAALSPAKSREYDHYAGLPVPIQFFPEPEQGAASA